MNCQDISVALDDRDIGALSEAERREFDAHLGACADCALDWEIHQRMLAATTPTMPAALPTQLRGLVVARFGSRHGRRTLNRFVLLGVVLAVGAAAALLVMQVTGTPTPQLQGAVLAPASTSATAPAAATSAVSNPSDAEQVEPRAEEEQAATNEPEAAVKPFTVRVLPLQNGLKDPSQQAVVALLYDGFLGRLRKVPGLTLLEPERGIDPEARPDFRITMTSAGSGDSFGASMQTEMFRPDGTVGATSFFTSGRIMANCANVPVTSVAETDSASCADPGTAAANLVGRLRTKVFPPDPTLRRQLQLQVADRSLTAQERQQAMLDVSQFGDWYGGVAVISATPGQALRDPALLRGAVDLATTTADPVRRAEVWSTLRGVGNPMLEKPLLTAFRQDPNGEVRLAALGTLTADFGKDESVHAALQSAAQKDARPLIRALAERSLSGLSGDAAWRDYVIASLKDTNRTAVERVEALFYHMGLPVESRLFLGVKAPAAASIFQQFDHDAIRTLLELLPVAATESNMVRSSTVSLMNSVIGIEDPAVTDMLAASLDGGSGSLWINRAVAVQALLRDSRRNDPRVHAALEKIGANDPDPQIRQLVTVSLQGKAPQLPTNMVDSQVAANGGNAAANSAEKPLRFGVYLNGMVAGPFVPQEMVGKAVVSSVAADSVGQKAGVKEGDVLLEINGTPLSAPAEIVKIVATVPRGVDVEVLVSRDGEKLSLKARF